MLRRRPDGEFRSLCTFSTNRSSVTCVKTALMKKLRGAFRLLHVLSISFCRIYQLRARSSDPLAIFVLTQKGEPFAAKTVPECATSLFICFYACSFAWPRSIFLNLKSNVSFSASMNHVAIPCFPWIMSYFSLLISTEKNFFLSFRPVSP